MMKFARGVQTEKNGLQGPQDLPAFPRAGLTGTSSTQTLAQSTERMFLH